MPMETHPYGIYLPKEVKRLLIGSFPGKAEENNDWFYGSKRNQFWIILESIYGRELRTKTAKQKLFDDLRMAVTDIILSCERKLNSNLDTNLVNIVYNTKVIERVLNENNIETIYFSSRFVEKTFIRIFKNKYLDKKTKFITLPSPSPRYAVMNVNQKIKSYKKLLPNTN